MKQHSIRSSSISHYYWWNVHQRFSVHSHNRVYDQQLRILPVVPTRADRRCVACCPLGTVRSTRHNDETTTPRNISSNGCTDNTDIETVTDAFASSGDQVGSSSPPIPLDTPTSCHAHQYVCQVQEWLQQIKIRGTYTALSYPLETKRQTLHFIRLDASQDGDTGNATFASFSLHLLPTPICLADCVPAWLTQSLTDQTFLNHTRATETNNSTLHPRIDTSIWDLLLSTPVVHLHQDIWSNPHTGPIARARLACRLGQRDPQHVSHKMDDAAPSRIYARHTVARRIQQPTAVAFLEHHHLWGATQTKYAFGLYYQPRTSRTKPINPTVDRSNDLNDVTIACPADTAAMKSEVLVAVATFSSRRNVQRGARMHRSHELIRFCSQRHGVVVGGISKLLKAFIACCAPDDIVTVIDRDWGVGRTSWHPLGFETVATMPPIPMVIRTDKELDSSTDAYRNRRRRFHLVGVGIQPEPKDYSDDSDGKRHDRVGIPLHVGEELASVTSYVEALRCLDRHSFYPIHDAGVERMVLDVTKLCKHQSKHDSNDSNSPQGEYSISDIWNTSIPTYAAHYYSDNPGIGFLLRNAE